MALKAMNTGRWTGYRRCPDIKAFVTLKKGQMITVEDLQAHCAKRMARFMVPKQIVVLDEMPRTPTGKPEKGKTGFDVVRLTKKAVMRRCTAKLHFVRSAVLLVSRAGCLLSPT